MQAWMFQGNPSRYDVDELLKTVKAGNGETTWRTPRFSSDIKQGAPAFIWRSAGRSGAIPGVVALARVTEEPRPMESDHQELARDLPVAEEFRTPMEILDVRLSPEEGMLQKALLLTNEATRDLPVFRLTRSTVYRLSAAHFEHLIDLWNRRGRRV
ncbi:MAG: EVE domain-containing protein [Fimbriimonadaceae bacterium]